MQLVYFETTRADHQQDDVHAQVVADMKTLAESLPEFILWRDVNDDLLYWGVVMFETEAAAIAWRDHPDHARIHRQSRGKLYTAFKTIAFDSVRSNAFEGD